MALQFKASEQYWKSSYALSPSLKEAARQKWEVFKVDPFDPRLGTHKINSLSARAGRTVWSSVIAADLRVVFYIDGKTVFTIDIGTHDVYR